MDDERVCRHARDVLAEIAGQGADEEFLLLCHFFNDDNDLERACWMLAHTLDPSVDIESFEHRVNQWGRQFLVKISGDREQPPARAGLGRFYGRRVMLSRQYRRLLQRAQFAVASRHRNSDGHPHHARNPLPHGRRSRRHESRWHQSARTLYRAAWRGAFRPVSQGANPGKGRLRGNSRRQNLKLRASHLEAATPRQILLRVLANLLYVYDLRKDLDKHTRVNTWIKALSRER